MGGARRGPAVGARLGESHKHATEIDLGESSHKVDFHVPVSESVFGIVLAMVVEFVHVRYDDVRSVVCVEMDYTYVFSNTHEAYSGSRCCYGDEL